MRSHTVKEIAAMLRIHPCTLRAMLRRAQRVLNDGVIEAHLTDLGLTARKYPSAPRDWRIVVETASPATVTDRPR